jgi:hypothetical protein
MALKKYSSYKQIEEDLEILKLEREIYYRKAHSSIEKTKESILPSTSVSFLGNLYDKVFSGTYGTLFKIAIPYLINWYINKKRGD